MRTNEEITGFKNLLDEHYSWPAKYNFKFILPALKEEEIMAKCFSGSPVKRKLSANGRYVSLTANRVVKSSDEVLEVYKVASTIEGVISL